MSPPVGPADVVTAPPRSVQTAFWLCVAIWVVVQLSRGVLFFALLNYYLTEVARLDQSAFWSVIGGVLSLVISFGLLLFFAVKMRAGKNWARITLTVVGVLLGIGRLPGLIGLAFAAEALFIPYLALSVLLVALVMATIAFMFGPNTAPYFRSAQKN